MGDTDAPTAANPVETGENTTCDITKPSIDILKESKPSENIAIEPSDKTENAPTLNALAATIKATKTDKTDELKVEELKNEKVDVVSSQVEELKNEPTAIHGPDKSDAFKERSSLRNKSDIFSLNDNKNMSSTIFSVGGAPSKTIYKTTSINSSRTTSSIDTIGSTSSRRSQFRNPLTGFGVNSNDEYKNKSQKRKDGNPLLGVGYTDDDEFFSPPTTQRIPPGGHSNGLW